MVPYLFPSFFYDYPITNSNSLRTLKISNFCLKLGFKLLQVRTKKHDLKLFPSLSLRRLPLIRRKVTDVGSLSICSLMRISKNLKKAFWTFLPLKRFSVSSLSTSSMKSGSSYFNIGLLDLKEVFEARVL